MRINNNLMAMNTHRQLGIATSGGAKSMEKLSSGFRINRAGDDAAGLAISEKMRGQIRGLNQASSNAQDGISLIQTTEGALNETHAILQRMRELAVQSSTDTNTDKDRGEIQKEIDQLSEEITRIADTTQFNTMNLLDGTYENKKFHIGANEGQDVTIGVNDMGSDALKVSGSGKGKAGYEVSIATGATMNEADLSGTGLKAGDNKLKVVDVDNVVIGSTAYNHGLTNEAGDLVAVSTDGKKYELLTEATKAKDLAGATIGHTDNVIDFTNDKVVSGEVTFKASAVGVISDIKATGSVDVSGLKAGQHSIDTTAVTAGTFKDFNVTFDATTPGTTEAFNEITSVLRDSDGKIVAVSDDETNYYAMKDIDLEATGAGGGISDILKEATAKPAFTLAAAGADGDKIDVKANGGINVSTQEAASSAITTINDALETVSAERSKLGAMQNRLEHTIKNLDTSAENLQQSESRIRDVDMAKEMMEQTKNNILQQASQAMLAQANQAPQGVLQLLG